MKKKKALKMTLAMILLKTHKTRNQKTMKTMKDLLLYKATSYVLFKTNRAYQAAGSYCTASEP